MVFFSRLWQGLKRHTGILVLVAAALLLEAVFAIQYVNMRARLSETMEQRVLSEMRIEALYIKRFLSQSENVLKNHVWDAERLLDEPDSMYHVCRRLLEGSDFIQSSAIAFRPDYYPQKGRLYEPFAGMKKGGTLRMQQLAGEGHDYTQLPFYQQSIHGDTALWCLPYEDSDGAGEMVTSYALPVRNANNEPVASFVIDLPVRWMGEQLNARHLYPSSFAILLDEEGRLIARPSADSISLDRVEWCMSMVNDSTVAREKSKDGRATIIDFNHEDKDGLIFYATLRGVPRWQLAIVCYDDEVYADLKPMHITNLLIMLFGLLILFFILQRFAHNIRQLERAKGDRERIESELRIASNIQQEMLPAQHHTQSADRQDCRIAGLLQPAREVDGDLYDFFVRDEKLFFCIGDVSGKGVPSALLMAVIHTLFRSACLREANPARIMQTINEAASEGNELNMFVTLLLGVLDLPTGRLRYCNAGHDNPVLMTDEGIEMLPVKANLPVGVFGDFKYEVQYRQLTPGTTLLLYTDGLTEAKNSSHEQFGMERVRQVAADALSNDRRSPDVLLKDVQEAVRLFVQDAEQSDDLTLLAIQYTPHKESVMLEESLTLKNDISEVARLNTFMESMAARLGMPTDITGQVKLAVEEAVVNAIYYAYPKDTEGEVTVTVKGNPNHLKVVITDHGTPFDPTEAPLADTSLSVEERPIGGLGIFLVRQLMDSLNYERINGANVLTMKKLFNK